ncbi:MAG: hypothetical protein FWH32_07670 [Clostridiales bacterium]|nr:hypothetical protein [Clostridiales bacterium]
MNETMGVEIITALIINLAILIALIAVLLLWARRQEKGMTSDTFVVRRNKIPAFLGVAIIAVFGFLLFAMLLGGGGEEIDYSILPIIFVFLAAGVFIIADFVYWRVSVYKNRIAYRALFRKSWVIEFGDITHAKSEGLRLSVYAGPKRLLLIAATYPGHKMMLERLTAEGISVEHTGYHL